MIGNEENRTSGGKRGGPLMALLWHKAFKQLCDENPSQHVFVFYDEAMEKSALTRKELWTYSSRFADMLKKCGLQRGDVVMCTVPTGIEIAIVNVGIFMAGGVVVNNEVQPENLEVFLHCVNKSKAKYLVMRNDEFDLTWNAFKSNISTRQPNSLYSPLCDSRMPSVRKAMFVCRRGSNDFIENLTNYTSSFVDYDIKEDQLAILHVTSGTTGMPKLVMRSHRSLVKDGQCDRLSIADAFLQIKPFPNFQPSLKPRTDFTKSLPETVSSQKVLPQCSMVMVGGKLNATILKTDPVRFMFLTPPEMEGILEYWHEPDRKFSDLLFIAGYPVTKQLLEWMFSFTNSTLIRYGSSEIADVSNNYIDRIEEFKDFDTGIVSKSTEIKTINEKQEELPSGVPGRILIRNQSMFSGYMGEEEKTRDALTLDGWLLTSDAGYIDPEKHLIIIGRYDYVIKQNGKIIYPSTIEAVIRRLPDVKEVVVAPITKDSTRDDICAFVVKETGSALTENDVIKKVAESRDMTGSKVAAPQQIIFLDAIERNSRGKINRNQLIEIAQKAMKK